MSKKYFDKLMTGSGHSSKKVQSKFGEAMLKKMGWAEGKGLGKKENGDTDCFQIKRREDQSGLGTKTEEKKFKWDDAFWVNMYDNVAKKLSEKIANDETESSSDEEIVIVKRKKLLKSQSMKISDPAKISKSLSKEERKKQKKLKRKLKAESFKVSA